MKQITTTGPGLLWVIPSLGRPVPLKWAIHFKSINAPINYNVEHMIIVGKPVADARNEACEMALERGCKYLFFLGDDVVPLSLNTLRQLIYRMETIKDCGVIGGVYSTKCEPSAPLIFRENGQGSYWDWKIGELIEITGIGMDCTLIRTEILKELPKPWFQTLDNDKFDDGINQADQWTEDLYFCKKVTETETWKIYADCSLMCEHWDVYDNKAYMLPYDSPPVCGQLIDKTKLKKAVDLGCGQINRSQDFGDYNLVRVDIREECEPDYRCDVRKLPFANEEFDLVFSSHVLEHFSRAESPEVLKEWIRILKPNGLLCLILPDVEWAFQTYKESKDSDVYNVLYGAQSNSFDYHQCGYTEKTITKLLNDLDFSVTIKKEGYNMRIEATRG